MYDAIIVGARCAGSPTAMLLARRGRRVLLLERAAFPADSLSTHYIHQAGVARLARWGLLDRLAVTGCPPIRDYRFDAGPFALTGAPPPIEGVDAAYSPRRYVLDTLLAEAAAEAGAEIRHGVRVRGLLAEDGRVTGVCGGTAEGDLLAERARVVIGADGRNSTVAREAGAETYEDRGTLTCAYYSYWTGVPLDGVELYPRPGRMIVTSPTHDGRNVVIVLWPQAEFEAVRTDIEGAFQQAVALAPGLAERLRAGTRVEPFRGTRLLPNHFRRAAGPGWTLVGDAGCHKDPILALGISDAFRDADLLAEAVDRGLDGDIDAELAAYGQRRDELTRPGFESTVQFAALQPPSPEQQALFALLRGDQALTDRFFGTFAGTVAPEELLSAAGAAAGP
jgi:2-polyprenyl-6-methoxyphenol hydroxylase-like FAD-dependent oxidoreductase